MGVSTQQYIRKPLYVDAVRVNTSNFEEIAAWCQGEIQTDESSSGSKKFIKVRVHNPKNPRQTKAFIGDWLLYTERGYKVYTNKAFRGAFDLVEEPVGEEPQEESAPTGPPTPPDEEIELVKATPEAIAEVMNEQQPVEAQEETTDKRVLTEEEQQQMGADEVQDLVRSGEAVLAQDLA